MTLEPEKKLENERKLMVQEQLIGRLISDKAVLEAFLKVPRHKFVPPNFARDSYGDYPLGIGHGQTISQPYMVALMTQCLKLQKSDNVLEIGTGSGYQTAILAELACQVYTIERVDSLSRQAHVTLGQLGYNNIKLKSGDGTLGWEEFAPYDAIVVTCGAPSTPPPLKEQLRENGRLVIPIGETFSQMLTLVTKHKGEFIEEQVCACVFVPLVGKYGWSENA